MLVAEDGMALLFLGFLTGEAGGDGGFRKETVRGNLGPADFAGSVGPFLEPPQSEVDFSDEMGIVKREAVIEGAAGFEIPAVRGIPRRIIRRVLWFPMLLQGLGEGGSLGEKPRPEIVLWWVRH